MKEITLADIQYAEGLITLEEYNSKLDFLYNGNKEDVQKHFFASQEKIYAYKGKRTAKHFILILLCSILFDTMIVTTVYNLLA